MIGSLSQENDVVKWLLSEIINYHTEGKPVIGKYSRWWASKTRLHKLIFSIIEEFDLNVTRSLYMWGGFVHSDILGEQFSHYRSYYHAHPDSVERNREKVKKLDISVEGILEYLIKNESTAMKLDSINELQYYYIKNIPEQYNSLYTSKQFITVDLSQLANYANLIDPINFFSLCDNLINNFSTYHISSINLIEDNQLIDTNYAFTDLIESSLEKIKYLIYNEDKIKKGVPRFYKNADNFFNNFAWKPYACKVSQETVKGFRSEAEKIKMGKIENSTIIKGTNEILTLKELNEKNQLFMNWSEYQFIKSKEEHEDYKDTINEIIKLYQKSDSE